MLRSLRNTVVTAAVLLAWVLSPGYSQPTAEVFNPNADGNVYALARQPDGKIIAAGSFHFLNPNGVGLPWDRRGLVRLNPDGTVDYTFWAEFDGPVHTVVLQPDGKVIVAGRFTTVRSHAAENPVPRNGLARLETDGRLDLAYDPNPQGTTYPQPLVRAMTLQPDGRLVVAGGFTGFQPNGQGEVIARGRLARLNSDGTVDTTFDPEANGVVLALTRLEDGRLAIGGGFTAIRPTGGTEPIERLRFAVLRADGTLDDSIQARFDNRVTSILRQADGSLLLAGDFIDVEIGDSGSITQPRMTRIAPDGSFDSGFRPVPNSAVTGMAVQADGKILIGGRFNLIYSPKSKSSVARSYIARLNPDGTVDTSLTTFPNAEVASFLPLPDGSFVIGGYFTTVVGTGANGGVSRNHLARLLPNGAVDTSFRSATSGSINDIARLPDGGYVVVGSFRSFAGVTRDGIVKLLPDLTVDPSFDPEMNNESNFVVVQPDGRFIVGGAFTRVEGETKLYVVRFNADGSVDRSFNPAPNQAVLDAVVQSDGKIVLVGQFTAVAPNGAEEETTRNFIARFNADGSLDTTFNPNAGNIVQAIELLDDGSMLIGGFFTAMRPNNEGDSQIRRYFAKIKSDGTLDENFDLGFSGVVSAIALQPDGKVLVGGSFGSVLEHGGTSAVARANLARFNADGTLDTDFDPSPNSVVNDIAVLSDGRIQIAGLFSTVTPNGSETALSRPRFAWLEADGTAPDQFAWQFNGDVATLLPVENGALVGGAFSLVKAPDGSGIRTGSGLVRFDLDGTLDTGFQPNAGNAVTGSISAISVQEDGRIIFGGEFSRIAGSSSVNLMRIGSDGTPDSGFFAKPDGPVHAILPLDTGELSVDVGGPAAVLGADGEFLPGFSQGGISKLSGVVRSVARQADGSIIVGGLISSPDASWKNVFRFKPDGSLDRTFAPDPGASVNAIAVQSDGKIIIGGSFVTIGEGERNRLARFNPDGTLDTTWDPAPNGTVTDIEILADGKILVSGLFTGFNPNGAEEAVAQRGIARINTDGTIDTAFAPAPNAAVNAIEVLDDNSILIGGTFTNVGTVSRPYFARLNVDGSLDEGFDPRPNSTVNAIAVQSDGKYLIGGEFTTLRPNASNNTEAEVIVRPYLARVNPDGTVDADFNPSPNDEIEAIAVLSDGRILIGGAFTLLQPDITEDPSLRNAFARLLPTGEVDGSYNPLPNGRIEVIEVFDGDLTVVGGSHTSMFPPANLVVAGAFQNFSDAASPYLARVFNNGLVDPSFADAPNAPVYALAAQLDGAVLVAGEFTQLGGTPRNHIARFTSAGAIDADFDPNADGTVRTVVVQPDGRIMIGGDFENVGGATAIRIARLETDGSVDASFSASIDGPVHAIVPLPDGGYLVGGDFAMVNLISRPYLARLNADGTLDGAFAPAPDGVVWSIALQGDGSILVGGEFGQIGGGAADSIARLKADGTLDTSLQASSNGAVHAIVPQFDGSVIFGGTFTESLGEPRTLFARIPATGAATQAFSVNDSLDSVTFTLGGTSADLTAVRFAYSEDSDAWTVLGPGVRTGQPGQWRVSGATLPADQFYFIRVEGILATNRYGSGSTREFIAQFFGNQPVGGAQATGGGSGEPTDTGGAGGGSGSDGGSGSGSGDGNGGGSGIGGNLGSPIDVSAISLPSTGLANLSGRGVPEADAPLITGFVVRGTGEQKLLLRAIGNGLVPYGVANPLERPVLRLLDSEGQLVKEVTGWDGPSNMSELFPVLGAFDVAPADGDVVWFTGVQPGAYTVHVLPEDAARGVVLSEIYVAALDGANNGSIANVSLRGPVGTGSEALVAGFNVDADSGPRRLLVRGLGPALAGFGISNAVGDPVLGIYDEDGALVADNDDWDLQRDYTADEMAALMAQAGAGKLTAGSADAATVVTLEPGIYTIQVSGDAPGIALIEIYDLP